MRKVGVELTAQVAGYVRDVKAAEQTTRGLADQIDETAKSGLRAQPAMLGLGRETGTSGRAAQGASHNYEGMTRELGQLDRKIVETSASLVVLSREFANTGRMDLLKPIMKEQASLNKLAKIRKTLVTAAEDAAPEMATGLASKLGPALGGLLPGPVGLTLAGAAVAASPLIGAAVSGAVLGGVGIGGVVGGLVLAAQDERVRAAAGEMADRLQARLTAAGASFVEPAIVSVHQLERALDQVDIEGLLADASRFVQPLVAGLSSALVDLGVGVDALMRNAGPAVESIGRGIAEIGDALGDGLASLADNGDDAADALDKLFLLIAMSLDSVFALVNGLSETYGWLLRIGALGVFGNLRTQMDGAAGGARRVGEGTFGAAQNINVMASAMKRGAVDAKDLSAAQKLVGDSQTALQGSLDHIAEKMSRSSLAANTLRSAMDALYGASIRQVDANESYQASFDGLRETVKANAGQFAHHTSNLSANTKAGRSNRDALEGLIVSSTDLYVADVAAGVSVAEATRRHQGRIKAVKEEAHQVGLNKGATDDLISTYGRVPKKKQTDLLLQGVDRIADALRDLYVFQRALADGIPIASEIAKLKGEKGPAKKYGGYASGGYTGAGAKYEPAGIVHRDEFVVRKEARRNVERQAPGFLDAMNTSARLPGYVAGGLVAPVDTSTRWPFKVNASGSRVMTEAQVASKVTPGISAGGMTYKGIEAAVQVAFPGMAVLSDYRPGARTLSGNVSYHALGRAVDYPPSRPLAEWFNVRYKPRIKELITPYQDLNLLNGQHHAYSGAIWNEHNFAGGNAHDHVAMANGGVINEPVYGVGASGRTYSFAENGRPETVIPGIPQFASAGGGGAPVTYISYSVSVTATPLTHPAEVGRQVVNAIQDYERGSGRTWRTGRNAT